MLRILPRASLIALAAATLAACSAAPQAREDKASVVTAARLTNAAAEPQNWLTHGGT